MIEESKSSASSTEDKSNDNVNLHADASWGPWVFRLTLAATLFFMWWLVIYDHGVVAHH